MAAKLTEEEKAERAAAKAAAKAAAAEAPAAPAPVADEAPALNPDEPFPFRVVSPGPPAAEA